jgi:hypothetical protein
MAPKKAKRTPGKAAGGGGVAPGAAAVEKVEFSQLPRKTKGTLEDAVERLRQEKFADFSPRHFYVAKMGDPPRL